MTIKKHLLAVKAVKPSLVPYYQPLQSNVKNAYGASTNITPIVSNPVNTLINSSLISAVSNALSQKNNKINVYGASKDITAAREIMGEADYKYIKIGPAVGYIPRVTSNDIVVGGSVSTGIPDAQLHGARRLAGIDLSDTKNQILAYAISINPKPSTNSKIINVYGALTDIDNAKRIMRGAGYNSGYNYVRTDLVPNGYKSYLKYFSSKDLILGGTNTYRGVPDVDLNGAQRLYGKDASGTASAITQWLASKNKPPQTNVKNVYGASIDVQNAKRILGTSKYNYILTDQAGFKEPKLFTSNDIILGGEKADGGIGHLAKPNGVTRLWGNTVEATVQKIKDYNKQKNGTKTVYGAEADIDNAKMILGSGYNYIRTDIGNK